MLNNVLKEKIEENEKVYAEGKAALEKIIEQGNKEYSKLLSNYKSECQYIKNNSMLSEAGKIEQGIKLHNDYLKKVKDAAAKYIKQLQNKNTEIIKSIESEQEKNYEVLKGQKIPQIVYVNCMMNSINSPQEAQMLKEVFDYACLEDNFSLEVMNLIYIKANSLLNQLNGYETKVSDENQTKSQTEVINNIRKNADLRTTLKAILTEINKFKHDYITEFNEFDKKFNFWLAVGQYPKNLILATDFTRDFALDPDFDKNNPWNKNNRKGNNLWNR